MSSPRTGSLRPTPKAVLQGSTLLDTLRFIEHLGDSLVPLLPSYRVKILDGTSIEASEPYSCPACFLNSRAVTPTCSRNIRLNVDFDLNPASKATARIVL